MKLKKLKVCYNGDDRDYEDGSGGIFLVRQEIFEVLRMFSPKRNFGVFYYFCLFIV